LNEHDQEAKKDIAEQSEGYRAWKNRRRPEPRMPNKVRVTIVEMNEGCPLGFKPGDTWIVDPTRTPVPDMCADAYEAVRAAVVSMGFGGEFPFHGKDVTWVACPDPNRPVVYEIRRLEEKIPPPKRT
jgi:uncharacterized repeat protein (TIGR04076 family)